jgi:hypothetical protein
MLGAVPGYGEVSTTNSISFSNQVMSLAVAGLWGCTSVVAVSEQGAWASHFWESTSFANLQNFPYDVLNKLWLGTGIPMVNEYGLGQLRNNDAILQGHMFDDVNNPRIFIMTPRIRDDHDSSETAGGDSILYPWQIDKVEEELRKIFGDNADISTIQYSPLRFNAEDNGFDTHRGKLLVQYQPAAQACQANTGNGDQPQAKWRLWIEGRGKLTISAANSFQRRKLMPLPFRA